MPNTQNQNQSSNNQKSNASNAPKTGKDQDPRRDADLPRAGQNAQKKSN